MGGGGCTERKKEAVYTSTHARLRGEGASLIFVGKGRE